MTKHTPGPWKVYHWDTHSDLFDGSDEHESPYVLETSKEVDLLDEHDANAWMMQAAPELYAVVAKLVTHKLTPSVIEKLLDEGRVALKKARGE
jgi:hypothetical protein